MAEYESLEQLLPHLILEVCQNLHYVACSWYWHWLLALPGWPYWHFGPERWPLRH